MDNRSFILVGGGNGAGKTTFIKNNFLEKYTCILPDEIYLEEKIKDTFTLQQIVKNRIDEAVNKRESIVFEHNLHTSTILERLIDFEKRGYETYLLYFGTDNLNVNIDRVNERYRSGTGHFVDENTINDRYYKGLSNVKINLSLANHTFIIDNSTFQANVVLYFEKGILIERNAELPKWVKKQFDLQLKLQEKLGLGISKDLKMKIQPFNPKT